MGIIVQDQVESNWLKVTLLNDNFFVFLAFF